MHDPLGDAMKALERASAPAAYPRDLPVYARIDGRGFSRFTRGMDKPFDLRMTRAMLHTAEALFEQTGARAAYVQSDEISLIWEPTPEKGEHFFLAASPSRWPRSWPALPPHFSPAPSLIPTSDLPIIWTGCRISMLDRWLCLIAPPEQQ